MRKTLLTLFAVFLLGASSLFAQGAGAIRAQEIYSSTGTTKIDGAVSTPNYNSFRLVDQFTGATISAKYTTASTDCGALVACISVISPALQSTAVGTWADITNSNFVLDYRNPVNFPYFIVGDLPHMVDWPTGWGVNVSDAPSVSALQFGGGKTLSLTGLTLGDTNPLQMWRYKLVGNPTIIGQKSIQLGNWFLETGTTVGDLSGVSQLKFGEFITENKSPSFAGSVWGPEIDVNHIAAGTVSSIQGGLVAFGPSTAGVASNVTNVATGWTVQANQLGTGSTNRMIGYSSLANMGASATVQGWTGIQLGAGSVTPAALTASDSFINEASSIPGTLPSFGVGKTWLDRQVGAGADALTMGTLILGGAWNTGDHFIVGAAPTTGDHYWWAAPTISGTGGFYMKAGGAPSGATDWTATTAVYDQSPGYARLVIPNIGTGNSSILGSGAMTIDSSSGVGISHTVTINTGVGVNGGGLKHQSVTTGAINAATYADVTITWTSAFADANYDVQCSVLEATTAGASIRVDHVNQLLAGSVRVTVFNGAAGPLTGTLYCLGIHQ